MAMPFWDVEAAVTEIARGAPTGLRGILFTGEPHRFGLPSSGTPTGTPLVGRPGRRAARSTSTWRRRHGDLHRTRPIAATSRHRLRLSSTDLFLKNGLQVADLITSGVLVRFPELKFVSVESGIGWIPFVLEAADHSYLEAVARGAAVSGRCSV